MDTIKGHINKVASGEDLTREEAKAAFDVLMSGEATPSQVGGLLMALRVKGETVNELAGAVSVMREKMLVVNAPANAIDIVGTGGDAKGSYNVSTCAAFVASGAGVPIAKHGNRALSSLSGAADTLTALGVNIEIKPQQIARCIREAGLGFMFAPNHHAAMRHVGPSRVELGTRTIFNLLGPLSNPAGVKRQLVGVFAPQWVEPVAQTLGRLGSDKVWVVHGDGLDEITVTGPTKISILENGEVRDLEITPKQCGVATHPFEQIIGGDAAHNASALREVLEGTESAYGDMVLMNAAAALVVADKAKDLLDGMGLARQAITSGQAMASLEKLKEISNLAVDER